MENRPNPANDRENEILAQGTPENESFDAQASRHEGLKASSPEAQNANANRHESGAKVEDPLTPEERAELESLKRDVLAPENEANQADPRGGAADA